MEAVNIANVKLLKKGQCFNVLGIKDKKLKTRANDFNEIKLQGDIASIVIDDEIKNEISEPEVVEKEIMMPKQVEVKDEIIPEVTKVPEKERMPLYMFNNDVKKSIDVESKEEEPDLDASISTMKHEMEGKYKGFGMSNLDKVVSQPKPSPVASKAIVESYKKMLSTVRNATIMSEEVNKIIAVFDNLEGKLESLNNRENQLSDSLVSVSYNIDALNDDSKDKGERKNSMKNPKFFDYMRLTDNELQKKLKSVDNVLDGKYDKSLLDDYTTSYYRGNEDLVMRIEKGNSILQDIYASNQDSMKIIVPLVEEFNKFKNAIEEELKVVKSEKEKITKERNDFIISTEDLLKKIYTINEEVKVTIERSENTVGNRYNAIEEEKKGEVGIPRVLETPVTEPIQSGINSIPNQNVFNQFRQDINFKQAASQGGNGAAVNENDSFMNYEEPVSFRRAV